MPGTNSMGPYTVRIFLPFGDPDGMRIFDSFTSTVIGVVFKRTGFDEAKKRYELANPGVYILISDGFDENAIANSLLPTVYIGEGDPIIDRLIDHNANKDFWTWAIAFTSKGDHLNKAHIQYIEHRLILRAIDAKRCNMDNGNKPDCPTMSEADKADCNIFLNTVLSILPLAGLPIFISGEEKALRVDDASFKCTSNMSTPDTVLHMAWNGAHAKGKQTPSGFVIFKGSEAVLKPAPSASAFIIATRNGLIKKKILEEKNGKYLFMNDYIFTSPSNAACMISGTNTNGRTSWKDEKGKTLKAIQGELASDV